MTYKKANVVPVLSGFKTLVNKLSIAPVSAFTLAVKSTGSIFGREPRVVVIFATVVLWPVGLFFFFFLDADCLSWSWSLSSSPSKQKDQME